MSSGVGDRVPLPAYAAGMQLCLFILPVSTAHWRMAHTQNTTQPCGASCHCKGVPRGAHSNEAAVSPPQRPRGSPTSLSKREVVVGVHMRQVHHPAPRRSLIGQRGLSAIIPRCRRHERTERSCHSRAAALSVDEWAPPSAVTWESRGGPDSREKIPCNEGEGGLFARGKHPQQGARHLIGPYSQFTPQPCMGRTSYRRAFLLGTAGKRSWPGLIKRVVTRPIRILQQALLIMGDNP